MVPHPIRNPLRGSNDSCVLISAIKGKTPPRTKRRTADRYGQNAARAREMLEAWVILPESELSKVMEILVISKSPG